MSNKYRAEQYISISASESGTRKECSIPDCGKRHDAKGFCQSHYKRLVNYGDPLGGRVPPGELLRFVREVAVPYQGEECLPWPFSKTSKGYGKVTIDGKQKLAHRYICTLVHGSQPTLDHEAAHSCGKGHEGCVSPKHLSWKTRSENMADKVAHGTHQIGERNGNSRLTEEQAKEALRFKGIKTQTDLANELGVSRGAICDIHCRRSWAWLEPVSEGFAQ